MDITEFESKPFVDYYVDNRGQDACESQTKLKAISALNNIQGWWCSPFKASTLIDIVHSIQPKNVVEIGVFEGATLLPVAFALQEIGDGCVYGIDPWDVNKSTCMLEGADFIWWNAVDHEKIYNCLLEHINEYGLSNRIQLIRASSEEVSLPISIDMLHIDGNASGWGVLSDVIRWMPKVRRGGVIIANDIYNEERKIAISILNKYCNKLAEFNECTPWGVWIKQ